MITCIEKEALPYQLIAVLPYQLSFPPLLSMKRPGSRWRFDHLSESVPVKWIPVPAITINLSDLIWR